jgi:hypothetical protein
MRISASPTQRSLRHVPVLLGLLCLATSAAAQEKFSEIARTNVSADHPPQLGRPHSLEAVGPARWQLPQAYTPRSTYIDHLLMAPGTAGTRPEMAASRTPNSTPGAAFSVPIDQSPTWMRTAPTLVHAVKQFRREGLPLVHLWQSQQYQLALGLSNHGRPGLYFTQKLGQ